MDADRILKFLRDLMSNNNREWFLANKSEYKDVRESFEQGVAGAIARIATFDPSVAHLTVKDCTYRFQRQVALQESFWSIYRRPRQEVAAWRILHTS